MTETKHTPTPFPVLYKPSAAQKISNYGGYCVRLSGRIEWHGKIAPVTVADVKGGIPADAKTAKDYADFIYRACNAHDDLVAALEFYANAEYPDFSDLPTPIMDDCMSGMTDLEKDGGSRARKALAKAKAGAA